MRARCSACRRQTDDSGQTIVELVIAMGLFMVILLAATGLIAAFNNSSNNTGSTTISAESAQITVQRIEHLIAGATSPSVASTASEQSGTQLGSPSPGSVTTPAFPCWGTANQSAPFASTSGQLTSPDTIGIITAHDYDFEFCAYGKSGKAGVAVPHVYRIWLVPSTCNQTTWTCSLEADDYSTACSSDNTVTAGVLAPCASGTSYAFTATTKPGILYTIPNVWCDSTCQTAMGDSAATATAAATNNHVANCTKNGNCPNASGTCTSNTATPINTPPIFTYFGVAGCQSGAFNPGALPLMDVASNDPSSGSGGCESPGSGATSDCSSLNEISSVQFEITIVGTPSPGQNVKTTNARTAIVDQIFMPNLVVPSTVPWAPGSLAASTSGANCGGKAITAGEVCLSFTVPFDGGSNITGFIVVPYIGNAAQNQISYCTSAASGCASPVTNTSGVSDYTPGANDWVIATGLTSNTGYTFKVEAVNAVGAGAPAITANPVQPT